MNNTQEALSQSNDQNRWILQQFSKGNYIATKHNEEVVFKSSVGANYTSNLAVRGFLTQTILAPSDYFGAYLPNRIVKPFLHVFFKTEQFAGLNAFVLVDAPGNS